jgi:hypothetical protein
MYATHRKLGCFNRFLGTLNTYFEQITGSALFYMISLIRMP